MDINDYVIVEAMRDISLKKGDLWLIRKDSAERIARLKDVNAIKEVDAKKKAATKKK